MNTNLRHIFGITLTATVLLSACGDPNSLDHKKKKLAALKDQLAEQMAEIAKLEAEIAKTDTEKKPVKSTLVDLRPIKQGRFISTIVIQGRVESDQVINISPRMGGEIKKIYVREGDYVKAGQLLAETDAKIIETQIEELKTQLDLAETAFSKQQRLWDQKIGTEMQYISAKGNRDALQKRLLTVKEQLDMAKIYAPQNGTIDQIMGRVGEMGAPGFPIMRIVGNGSYKVVTDVPETYIKSLTRGMGVLINFPDLNRTINGTVTNVSNVVDPVNRSIKIEIRLGTVGNDIKPNSVTYVEFNEYISENALSVPVELLQTTESGKVVYTAIEDRGKYYARKNVVKVGHISKGYAEILEGLKPDDQLVYNGYAELTDGQLLSINSSASQNINP